MTTVSKFLAIPLLLSALTLSSLTISSLSLAQVTREPPGTGKKVLHLLIDAEGRIYSTYRVIDPETGKMSVTAVKQFVNDNQLRMLQQLGVERNTEILIHPEAEFTKAREKSSGSVREKSSGSCPLYSSISFWVVTDPTTGLRTHHGEGQTTFSSNQGSGETTQWVTGNVATTYYSGQKSHSGVDLLDASVSNGGGVIFGDRSQDPNNQGCYVSGHSAQVEIFACPDTIDDHCKNIKDPSTCTYTNDDIPYYFEIQAHGTSPHQVDVTYWLDYWTGSAWAHQLPYPYYYHSMYSLFTSLDPNATGLSVFDAYDARASTDYTVAYTNLNCGWF